MAGESLYINLVEGHNQGTCEEDLGHFHRDCFSSVDSFCFATMRYLLFVSKKREVSGCKRVQDSSRNAKILRDGEGILVGVSFFFGVVFWGRRSSKLNFEETRRPGPDPDKLTRGAESGISECEKMHSGVFSTPA